MSEWITRLIESKRAYCAKLAAMPFEEKIRMLEKLRARSVSIRDAKRDVVKV